MTSRLPLYGLLALINVAACFVLGLSLMAMFATSPEAPDPVTPTQAILSMALYGLIVSLAFSLLSLLVRFIYRYNEVFRHKRWWTFFLLQFILLLVAYGCILSVPHLRLFFREQFA